MPTYRFYKIDENGRIAGPPPVVEALDDECALKEAREFVDGCDVEVWQGPRMVAYLTFASGKVGKLE